MLEDNPIKHASEGSGASIAAQQEVTIMNELGMHARPSAEFVRTARSFQSQIWLVKGEERFSAASILDVMSSNLNYGETAVIEAQGPDAEQAVKRLAELTLEFAASPFVGSSAVWRTEEDF